MEQDIASPVEGEYPYRLTHEERFQYRLKVQPVAGQLEFSIRPVDTRLAAMAARREWEGFPRSVRSEETDAEENIRRSKLRAKARVKLIAMEMGVDRLGTFTIRKVGDMVVSYDDLLRCWDLFRRLALRADRYFRYVAAPELQRNGQWHIHAGLSGYQNAKQFTRMWQAALNRVLGRDKTLIHGADSPGTFNIPKRPYVGSVLTRSKRIAKYIAKYIGKTLETGFNRKSHFHTTGIKVTPAQRQWLQAQSRDAAVIEVLRKWGLIDDGCPRVTIWNRDGQSAWFTVSAAALDPPPF